MPTPRIVYAGCLDMGMSSTVHVYSPEPLPGTQPHEVNRNNFIPGPPAARTRAAKAAQWVAFHRVTPLESGENVRRVLLLADGRPHVYEYLAESDRWKRLDNGLAWHEHLQYEVLARELVKWPARKPF